MSLTGHIQNGVVVFDTPNALPDVTAISTNSINSDARVATEPTIRKSLSFSGAGITFSMIPATAAKISKPRPMC